MPDLNIVSSRPAIAWVPPQEIDERLDAYPFDIRFIQPLQQLYAVDYEIKPLREIARTIRCGPFGSSVLAETYVDHGIPLLRPVNLAFGIMDFSDTVSVSPIAAKEGGYPIFGPGTILFARVGNVNVGVLPEHTKQIALGPNVIGVDINKSVDPFFVGIFAASRYGLVQLERKLKVVAQPTITTGTVRNFLVPLPPQPVQTYIGDKVRLAERCRSRARELWQSSAKVLSQALDLSLDTRDFESVNRAELQSEHYYLTTAEPVTAWVHPDIVGRELGAQYFHPRRANVIVKLRESGVHLKRLVELTTRRNERVTGAKTSQVPYYVGLGEIDSTMGHFNLVSPQQAGITGTSTLFKPDDILFSKLRPYLNKVSICPAHVKRACGSTELLVYRAHKEILPYYVFFVLKSNVGLYQVIDVTAGSTLPRVDPEIVDDILVPMIDDKEQKVISDNVRRVFELVHKATSLVAAAKADVEALIEGRLDVEGIVAGRVVAPAWEEITAQSAS